MPVRDGSSSPFDLSRFSLSVTVAFVFTYFFARALHQIVRQRFINQRKQKQLLQLFENLINSHHDGILITAGDKILLHNNRVSKIFDANNAVGSTGQEEQDSDQMPFNQVSPVSKSLQFEHESYEVLLDQKSSEVSQPQSVKDFSALAQIDINPKAKKQSVLKPSDYVHLKREKIIRGLKATILEQDKDADSYLRFGLSLQSDQTPKTQKREVSESKSSESQTFMSIWAYINDDQKAVRKQQTDAHQRIMRKRDSIRAFISNIAGKINNQTSSSNDNVDDSNSPGAKSVVNGKFFITSSDLSKNNAIQGQNEEESSRTKLQVFKRNIQTGGHQITITTVRDMSFYHELQKQKNITNLQSIAFASAAHEFRNPLNAIVSSLELLYPMIDHQHGSQYFNIAKSCSNLMLYLVRDILDFSQLQQKSFLLSMAPTSLTTIVEQCLEALSFKALEKGITLSYGCEQTCSFESIITDENRVKQILINLISNAIKYTQRGSVKVLASIPPNGEDIVHIQIADTGVGMTQEQLSKLFIPYTKILSNRKLNAEGVGLGLAVSKNIAHALGGDITVQSIVGRGTTFTLILPYKLAEQTDTHRNHEQNIEGHPRQLSNLSIGKRSLHTAKFRQSSTFSANLLPTEGQHETINNRDEAFPFYDWVNRNFKTNVKDNERESGPTLRTRKLASFVIDSNLSNLESSGQSITGSQERTLSDHNAILVSEESEVNQKKNRVGLSQIVIEPLDPKENIKYQQNDLNMNPSRTEEETAKQHTPTSECSARGSDQAKLQRGRYRQGNERKRCSP
ncbi:hypothetical protein FGO68_gene15757 [Halteria grandinella]|uniref:histidine kinase n=1 Tax=Halteria grandinella TaxID=5974 RepID=A0A8J8P3L5_HALGN|nr:hypothetical protein FGO68_gene15757 [Halteria grandinella]